MSGARVSRTEPADAAPILGASGLRVEGGLVVEDPPRAPSTVSRRYRSHVEGARFVGNPRHWVGISVPDWIPLVRDGREILLLDEVEDAYFATYVSLYGGGFCAADSKTNCSVSVALLRDGEIVLERVLDRHLSRPDFLEIQDIRFEDGTIFFNEACQSFSREVEGDCSRLVAYDPDRDAVLWRSERLISNGRFWVAEDYILAGYGFTSEADMLHLVDRESGVVLDRLPLPRAHQAIRPHEADLFQVELHGGELRMIRVRGEGTSSRLVDETGSP